MMKEEGDSDAETVSGQGKCTRQPARTAELNAKFLSSQQREDLFIAGTVGRNTNQVTRKLHLFSFSLA
jgi:hypothetical protein